MVRLEVTQDGRTTARKTRRRRGVEIVSFLPGIFGIFPASTVFNNRRARRRLGERCKSFRTVVLAGFEMAEIGLKNCKKLGSRTCKTMICQLFSLLAVDFGERRGFDGGRGSPGNGERMGVFNIHVRGLGRDLLPPGWRASLHRTSTPALPRSGFFTPLVLAFLRRVRGIYRGRGRVENDLELVPDKHQEEAVGRRRSTLLTSPHSPLDPSLLFLLFTFIHFLFANVAESIPMHSRTQLQILLFYSIFFVITFYVGRVSHKKYVQPINKYYYLCTSFCIIF